FENNHKIKYPNNSEEKTLSSEIGKENSNNIRNDKYSLFESDSTFFPNLDKNPLFRNEESPFLTTIKFPFSEKDFLIYDRENRFIAMEKYLNCANFLPQTGTWSGDSGDSVWEPSLEDIPDPENGKGGNPDKLTWKEILEKYGITGIEYGEGYPDFSPVAVGEVTIEPFTENRDKNFRQADEKLAAEWTKEGKDGKVWTARDVAEWRKENGYTWHECEDCKTMQLVPKEIHNNTPHQGGIAEIKKRQEENN
ncbi:TPA: HNH endonuclease, partial [Pasteurella multocida]|nr:HNH endonuclease [Pasteurella multocida]